MTMNSVFTPCSSVRKSLWGGVISDVLLNKTFNLKGAIVSLCAVFSFIITYTVSAGAG